MTQTLRHRSEGIKDKNSSDKKTFKKVEDMTKCVTNKLFDEVLKEYTSHTREVKEEYKRFNVTISKRKDLY